MEKRVDWFMVCYLSIGCVGLLTVCVFKIDPRQDEVSLTLWIVGVCAAIASAARIVSAIRNKTRFRVKNRLVQVGHVAGFTISTIELLKPQRRIDLVLYIILSTLCVMYLIRSCNQHLIDKRAKLKES